MATPDLADEDQGVEVPDEATPDADDGPEVEEIDLDGDDTGGGDLFSSVEGADDDAGDPLGEADTQGGQDPDADSGQSEESESDGDGDEVDPLGDLDGNAALMEDAVNEGAARLATVGLAADHFDGSRWDDREALEDEMADTFAAFRLGHFFSETMEQYVLVDGDDDVDPVWGLLGAVLMCGAMAVMFRPDGDELIGLGRDRLAGLSEGAA